MKKSNSNKLAKILFSISSILIIFCGFFISLNLNLPNQINITSGKSNKLSIGFPFKVATEDDAIEVSISNDKKSSSNITINSDQVGTGHITFNLLGIPVKTTTVSVLPTTKLIPSGEAVGVSLKTKGILVLGTGYVDSGDGKNIKPCQDNLKSGDILLSANSEALNSKGKLIEMIEKNEKLNFEVERSNKKFNFDVIPVRSLDDNKNKIGVWVRDSTEGIGTLTYYNPNTKKFAALGHGIIDVDTSTLMKIRDGEILKSNITEIKKGEKGSPGEIVGEIEENNSLGQVIANTKNGIYGKIKDIDKIDLENKSLEIGLKDEIKIGPAEILSDVDGNGVQSYKIEIQNVNINSDNEKGMIIQIKDSKLLDNTNGIIQGMSGSPIIQNKKIIGAVTHVFINDPTKGYGIFIETMLKEEGNI